MLTIISTGNREEAVTKVVFKSTSTLISQVTKFQDGIWKIFTKQLFTTFAEPD